MAAILSPNQGPVALMVSWILMVTSKFHWILDADWLWCLVAMVVTIENKLTISDKFYATGPRCIWEQN